VRELAGASRCDIDGSRLAGREPLRSSIASELTDDKVDALRQRLDVVGVD
jgi:hypothetical protein